FCESVQRSDRDACARFKRLPCISHVRFNIALARAAPSIKNIEARRAKFVLQGCANLPPLVALKVRRYERKCLFNMAQFAQLVNDCVHRAAPKFAPDARNTCRKALVSPIASTAACARLHTRSD